MVFEKVIVLWKRYKRGSYEFCLGRGRWERKYEVGEFFYREGIFSNIGRSYVESYGGVFLGRGSRKC